MANDRGYWFAIAIFVFTVVGLGSFLVGVFQVNAEPQVTYVVATPAATETEAPDDLAEDIIRLSDIQALSYWPQGYTDAFYDVLSRTPLVLDVAGDKTYACYVNGGEDYIFYVVRDGVFNPDEFEWCIPHEAGHLIDRIEGRPCSSAKFQVDVWTAISAADRYYHRDDAGNAVGPYFPPGEDETWVRLTSERIVGFPGVGYELRPGEWGGWCELYAELFRMVRDYDTDDHGLLQAIPPSLRPYYEKYMPWSTNELLPVPMEGGGHGIPTEDAPDGEWKR
jgi:hypothetical protein